MTEAEMAQRLALLEQRCEAAALDVREAKALALETAREIKAAQKDIMAQLDGLSDVVRDARTGFKFVLWLFSGAATVGSLVAWVLTNVRWNH